MYPQGEGVDVKPSRVRHPLRPGAWSKGNATATSSPCATWAAACSGPRTPSPKGTRFKIEVTNNAECYTYCFGQETDGRTYVLFPIHTEALPLLWHHRHTHVPEATRA